MAQASVSAPPSSPAAETTAAPAAAATPATTEPEGPKPKGLAKSHLIAGVEQRLPETENIKRLAQYLGHRMRIEIPDGRHFIGKFACMDKDRNIVLRECWEYRKWTWKDVKTGQECSREDKRNLNLVMVPGKYIVRAQADPAPPPPPPKQPAVSKGQKPAAKGKGKGRRRF